MMFLAGLLSTLAIYATLSAAAPTRRTCSSHPPNSNNTPAKSNTTASALGSASGSSSSSSSSASSSASSSSSSNCFPSLGFSTKGIDPNNVDLNNWWCNPNTEYAFVGFSYEVTACQSKSTLQKEFADMRTRFNSRYVRLYGACDRAGFYDDLAEAAWDNSLGVHALIWFGFDGGNQWQKRRDTLFNSLLTNPKAKLVTRVVQFGSEPLFDGVLTPDQLTAQVNAAKAKLASVKIPITVSDLANGYQKHGGGQNVLDAVDSINAHMLPFFSSAATTGDKSWPLVVNQLNWFIQRGGGKKIYLSENGWPSTTYSGVHANSKAAVANVQSESQYFNVLDENCSYFKKAAGGGVGWFAHLYSDTQEPGYGIYNTAGKLKFNFAPKTHC